MTKPAPPDAQYLARIIELEAANAEAAAEIERLRAICNAYEVGIKRAQQLRALAGKEP